MVDRPVGSKDSDQEKLPSPGNKRKHAEIEGECSDKESPKESCKKKSKILEGDEGAIFQFGMKQLEDKLKMTEFKFELVSCPTLTEKIPNLNKLKIQVDCM